VDEDIEDQQDLISEARLGPQAQLWVVCFGAISSTPPIFLDYPKKAPISNAC
jgi:hypothetical protein